MASRDPESVVARTVAVVGCGPGGMFFLHALELHRKKLLEEGKSIADLPIVTCFERASGPGGVWRSERVFQADQEKYDPPREKKVNIEPPTNTIEKDTKHGCNDDEPELATMYEALWTNGAKENTEFYDYTYDEHFGRRLPVHLPRRSVLEYMIARVTRNTPTLLENHVQFNTTVSSVTYNEGSKKFVVLTKDNFTGQATSGEYDKCIWAAGENGIPFIPKDLAERLKAFSGTIVHSSDASELDKHVQHKRILLIGGSYSAEDLALMSIKLGVEKVYISFRDVDAWVTHTSWWPQDKVELLADKVPLQASGNSVEFIKTRFDSIDSQFETDEEQKTVLEDIDTIIFCTGYRANYSMLDESLRPPTKPTELDNYQISSDWEMMENVFTSELGDIPVDTSNCDLSHSYVCPGLYRNVLMSNPNMMFFRGDNGEEPLIETDVNAHQFVAYVTGKTELPLAAEMARRNNEQFLQECQIPKFRCYVDRAYRDAFQKMLQTCEWAKDEEDERYQENEYKEDIYPWLVTSIYAKDGHYPWYLDRTKTQS